MRGISHGSFRTLTAWQLKDRGLAINHTFGAEFPQVAQNRLLIGACRQDWRRLFFFIATCMHMHGYRGPMKECSLVQRLV